MTYYVLATIIHGFLTISEPMTFSECMHKKMIFLDQEHSLPISEQMHRSVECRKL
jgi:hypothetical protein